MSETATMKALVKAKPEPGLWMQQQPIPEPGPDDVLIKIKKTAICGTDIHIYNWDEWAAATIPVPMIVGHEYVGEIVGLGDHVKRLSQRRDTVPPKFEVVEASAPNAVQMRVDEPGNHTPPSGVDDLSTRTAEFEHLLVSTDPDDSTFANRNGRRGAYVRIHAGNLGVVHDQICDIWRPTPHDEPRDEERQRRPPCGGAGTASSVRKPRLDWLRCDVMRSHVIPPLSPWPSEQLKHIAAVSVREMSVVMASPSKSAAADVPPVSIDP